MPAAPPSRMIGPRREFKARPSENSRDSRVKSSIIVLSSFAGSGGSPCPIRTLSTAHCVIFSSFSSSIPRKVCFQAGSHRATSCIQVRLLAALARCLAVLPRLSFEITNGACDANWCDFWVEKMSGDVPRVRKHDTLLLSIAVALGVIVLLAASEYWIPRWLHSGPGESGSFFSSNDSSAALSAPSGNATQIRPGENSDPSAGDRNGRNSALKSLGCPSNDPYCWKHKARPATRKKPSGNSVARSEAPESPAPDPREGATTPDTRATEQNVRAAEEATAHMIELEREELDRLSVRARTASDRIDAAQRQQPIAGQQREDLAFSQQRLHTDLNQADAALRAADVQKAQIYLDLAKGELDKISKLLARS
jgi:hypothetical protein